MGSCNCNQRVEIEHVISLQTQSIPKYTAIHHTMATQIQSAFKGYLQRKKYLQVKVQFRSANPKHSNSTEEWPIDAKKPSSQLQNMILSPNVHQHKAGPIKEEERFKSVSLFARKESPIVKKNRSISFDIAGDGKQDISPMHKSQDQPISPLISSLADINISPTKLNRFSVKKSTYTITPIMPHDKAIVNVQSKNCKARLPAIKLSNGNIYKGEWLDSKPEGRGRYTFSDQSDYCGDFHLGFMHGNGQFKNKEGHSYIGEWRKNYIQGYGVYQYPSGAKYEGYWEREQPHGQGREYFANGSYYKGSYKCGQKCGIGSLTFEDGSIFDGEFLADDMHGHGVYRWKDGRVYKGDWRNGKMHGKGMLKWPDGRIYTGEYKDDLKDGFGTFEYPDGRKYEGGWMQGLQHGEGQFHRNLQQSVRGIWHLGKLVTTLDQIQ